MTNIDEFSNLSEGHRSRTGELLSYIINRNWGHVTSVGENSVLSWERAWHRLTKPQGPAAHPKPWFLCHRKALGFQRPLFLPGAQMPLGKYIQKGRHIWAIMEKGNLWMWHLPATWHTPSLPRDTHWELRGARLIVLGSHPLIKS